MFRRRGGQNNIIGFGGKCYYWNINVSTDKTTTSSGFNLDIFIKHNGKQVCIHFYFLIHGVLQSSVPNPAVSSITLQNLFEDPLFWDTLRDLGVP